MRGGSDRARVLNEHHVVVLGRVRRSGSCVARSLHRLAEPDPHRVRVRDVDVVTGFAGRRRREGARLPVAVRAVGFFGHPVVVCV